jgi:hypothetical protein
MAIPSDAHLLAFGRIVHNFATAETGIKITVSAILEIRLADALVAFEPYGAVDLKNVAKSLAKEKLKPELAERFCCIVGDWAAFNYLRNLIAHSRWTDVDCPPGAIKPRGYSIREGRAKPIGIDPDETTYTASELEAAAHKIHLINERLKKFIQETGLRRIIDKKMAEANAEISADSGNDGKQSSR